MLSQIAPGPRTASKNGYFCHLRTYSARQAPFRFHRRQGNFNHHTDAGVSKSLLPIIRGFSSKRQPVNNPFKTLWVCIFKRARPESDQAPRDYFLAIFVNIYNRFLTVSKGAARLPFGDPGGIFNVRRL